MPRKKAPAERKRGRTPPVDPDDPRAVYEAGLRLLARREHSRRELTLKLAARRFTPTALECGLDSLESDGYLDEARFAEMLIRHRSDAGYGPLRIRAELASHAIEESRFEDRLQAIPEEFWLEHAKRIATRKLESLSGSSAMNRRTATDATTDPDVDSEAGARELASLSPQDRMRVLQALAQRGFPAEIAHRALRTALESADTPFAATR